MERKKHSIGVNEKKKLRKNGLYFIAGCFIKSFWRIIIFFLFRKVARSTIFAFCYQDDTKNIKLGNWERQIARNSKLQYLL